MTVAGPVGDVSGLKGSPTRGRGPGPRASSVSPLPPLRVSVGPASGGVPSLRTPDPRRVVVTGCPSLTWVERRVSGRERGLTRGDSSPGGPSRVPAVGSLV